MNNKKNQILANIDERIKIIDGGDYQARIVESLLDEPAPTPEEIEEFNSIED